MIDRARRWLSKHKGVIIAFVITFAVADAIWLNGYYRGKSDGATQMKCATKRLKASEKARLAIPPSAGALPGGGM